jgi:hypothetical protein
MSYTWVMVSLMFLIGCGSMPLGPDGLQNNSAHLQGFHLDFEEIMEFVQGQRGEFKIEATVPSPGAAILNAEGLAEGASLEGNTLIYTPPCSLSLAEGKFYRGYLSHRIRISLRSDKDSKSILQKSAVMIVFRHADPDRPCGE